jgi:DNA (cytosine-5)-methyltransferase 1
MLGHVDLCSGIGGFALGFEWAGLSKPVMFCDIEPWSRQILAKHWPDVPIEEDVKVLANEPERIPECSILTAGYPCQPFSQAGKRRGEEDDRHIWPYIRKIVAQKRPTWCVFENVYGHLSVGLDTVLSNLEADGYAARPFIVPACGVDAAHRRDRIWIVGYSEHNGSSTPEIARGVAETGQRSSQGQIEAEQSARAGKPRGDEDVANTERDGYVWGNGQLETTTQQNNAGRGEKNGRWERWEAEPCVGRVANGIPNRVDRLKGLGNAIVPQIAMQIGLTIKAVNDAV